MEAASVECQLPFLLHCDPDTAISKLLFSAAADGWVADVFSSDKWLDFSKGVRDPQ